MSNKKTKQVGKIIVVVLSVSIFFFLLLPFLESESGSTQEAAAKKATPQIFTSNPLSELARKIYAMFSGKRGSKTPQIPSQTNTIVEGENMLAMAPAETERYSAEHQANSQVSTVNATYDEYGNAGFINEEGEWVLIRQTAPETAERGMHEVSTADKAYDKYVRMERAAKYTGKTDPAATTEIPQSKWARLWRPIKKLFSKDEEIPVVDPTNTDKPFALASASAGFGKDRDIRTSRNRKTSRPELGGNMQFSLNNSDSLNVDKLINPSVALSDTASELIETARRVLEPQRAEEVIKTIKKDYQYTDENTRNLLKIKTETQLLQDVQQEQGIDTNILSRAFSASCWSPSSFHKSPKTDNTEPASCSATSLMSAEDLQDRRALFSQKLANELGIAPQGNAELNGEVMVLFDITTPDDTNLPFLQESPASNTGQTTDAPGQNDPASEIYYPLLKALYNANQCDRQNCYWIAQGQGRPAAQLQTVIDESGLNMPRDPLNKMNIQIQPLLNKIINDTPDEKLAKLLEEMNEGSQFPVYIPFTQKEIEQLAQQNIPVADENGKFSLPENTFRWVTPYATTAQKLITQVPTITPETVTYATSKGNISSSTDSQGITTHQVDSTPVDELFGADAGNDLQEKGRILQDKYIDHAKLLLEATKKAKQELEQKGAQAIFEAAAEQEMKKQADAMAGQSSVDMTKYIQSKPSTQGLTVPEAPTAAGQIQTRRPSVSSLQTTPTKAQQRAVAKAKAKQEREDKRKQKEKEN